MFDFDAEIEPFNAEVDSFCLEPVRQTSDKLAGEAKIFLEKNKITTEGIKDKTFIIIINL